MTYSIDEHRHRFAAWAAGRAASVKGCRFTVKKAKDILESVGLRALVSTPKNLPYPECFDAEHRAWRQKIIERAGEPRFTHGIAAKLINVYLKSAFVCGGYHEHPRVRAIHPPIDGLLLRELSES
ncbi:MAG: hypothetical protein WAN46_00075, partial [Gammaproteobacteria bacterium]